jgi:hypothetical protein
MGGADSLHSLAHVPGLTLSFTIGRAMSEGALF